MSLAKIAAEFNSGKGRRLAGDGGINRRCRMCEPLTAADPTLQTQTLHHRGISAPLAFQELAREHAPEAIKTLADIAKKGTPGARVYAAIALLDRAYGKATAV